MSLTKAVLTSPDENPFGKPVYVRGVLYLDDVPEDDSANDAGDSSVDKPGMLTMKNQKMVAETMTQICRRSGKKLPPNMKMTGIRQRLGMVS